MLDKAKKKYTKSPSCKANINIKTLKNSDELSFILDSSINAEITIDLFKLKDEPKAFAVVLAGNINKWIKAGSLHRVLEVYDESLQTPELDKIINNGLIRFLNNIQPRNKVNIQYKLGKDIPNTINGCIKFINDDTKSKILYQILKKQDNFYPYARKMLAQTAVKLANSDGELVDVLNSFYKVMEKNIFFEIIDRVTGGIDNTGIKKVLSKTNKFNICRYTKNEVANDKKKRIELLKDIAKTPSSVKNINFVITFSVSDLKELASVMRFNLLQWYFKDKFICAARNCRNPVRYKMRVNKYNQGKVRLDITKEKDLTEILFGVGMKKNDDVSKFVEKYKCYKRIEGGKAIDKSDITSAFGKLYKYYYW